jgi:hypothetical protein
MNPEAAERVTDVPPYRRSRFVAASAVNIYLVIIAMFFLPFVSASCEGKTRDYDGAYRSEVMSGLELVMGKEPVLTKTGNPDPKWGGYVLDAIAAASRASRWALGGVIVALVASVLPIVTRLDGKLEWLPLLGGGAGALGFAVLLGASGDSGAEVHHLYGFIWAGTLAFANLFLLRWEMHMSRREAGIASRYWVGWRVFGAWAVLGTILWVLA